MVESVKTKIDAKLAAFHEWSSSHSFTSCRLVQYCGVERVGASDLLPAEVGHQIEGCLSEGFYVDWNESCGRLYLRIWEFGGPEPSWPSVFAEDHLANIDEILRMAAGE